MTNTTKSTDPITDAINAFSGWMNKANEFIESATKETSKDEKRLSIDPISVEPRIGGRALRIVPGQRLREIEGWLHSFSGLSTARFTRSPSTGTSFIISRHGGLAEPVLSGYWLVISVDPVDTGSYRVNVFSNPRFEALYREVGK